MEDFLTRVNKRGAYIALMEDLIGEEINPNTFIMQNRIVKKETLEPSPSVINKLLGESCEALGGKETKVGEVHGYIEPCPIAYTGQLGKGDGFKTVFLGLNPHLEPPRLFNLQNNDENTTFADLANFHHPDDLYNICNNRKACNVCDKAENCDEYKKAKEKFSHKGTLSNEYWRVFGHMESGNAWSKYYTSVIRLHMALTLAKEEKNYDIFRTWVLLSAEAKELAKNEKYLENSPKEEKLDEKGKQSLALCNFILENLKNNPMANIEIIPYKSTGYSIKHFSSILSNPPQKYESEIVRYKNYLSDVFTFIDNYAAKDAYIVFFTNVKEEKNSYSLDETLKIVQSNITTECSPEYYLFHKEAPKEREKDKNSYWELAKSPERKSYERSPVYLLKWKNRSKDINRKIIISSSVSGQGNYNWIYSKFLRGHDFIERVNEYFNPKSSK